MKLLEKIFFVWAFIRGAKLKRQAPESNMLIYLLPELMNALTCQLAADEKRWGHTWRRRPRRGQEERIFKRYAEYFHDYTHNNIPIPWLKVIGEAWIALVREWHPGLLEADHD